MGDKNGEINRPNKPFPQETGSTVKRMIGQIGDQKEDGNSEGTDHTEPVGRLILAEADKIKSQEKQESTRAIETGIERREVREGH